jgi:hypothetical protein
MAKPFFAAAEGRQRCAPCNQGANVRIGPYLHNRVTQAAKPLRQQENIGKE